MKKVISLLLCVAMLLSVCALAGCGGNNGKKPTGGPGQSADQKEEDFFLDMPAELRGTTVQFATWIDHNKTDTAYCIAGFEETTGMKLELVQVNQGDYVVKMTSLIAAEQSPDVVVENGDFPKTLNLLMPLEVETTGLDVNDPFWDPTIVKTFTVGKYSYLVNGTKSSWHMAGVLAYFNKTILEENGITTPNELVAQNNWNKDSLWTLMEQIKSSCGFSRPGTSMDFDCWMALYGTGGTQWDTETDSFKTTLKEEKNREAINYLMKAQDAGLLKVVRHGRDDDITKGTMALEFTGAYGLRKSPGWFYTMDLADLGFEVCPKWNASDEDYPYTTTYRAYGICKGSKNPKGAAYFLRYFLNEDHYQFDEIFKNQEARDMYVKLRTNAVEKKASNPFFTLGIARVTDANINDNNPMVADLVSGTASQVSVNLDKAYNKCEGYVVAANKFMQDFLDNQ